MHLHRIMRLERRCIYVLYLDVRFRQPVRDVSAAAVGRLAMRVAFFGLISAGQAALEVDRMRLRRIRDANQRRRFFGGFERFGHRDGNGLIGVKNGLVL